MNVEQIMTRRIISVEMDDGLFAVRELFNQHKFHHLLVTDRGRLVGVVSDRDLLKNISPFIGRMSERTADAATLQRRVHQIMTRALVTVRPHTPVSEAAALLIEQSVSCLPVVSDAQRPVGILSWRDVLRTFISQEAANSPAPGGER